jgi:hypothetical protein
MLVQCVQLETSICRVQPFTLEETEDREDEEGDDEDETRELENEDD